MTRASARSLRSMPAAWRMQAIRLETCPPPVLPTRPIAERMFLELCSNRELLVRCGKHLYTLKKRGDKYSCFENGRQFNSFLPYECDEIIKSLSEATPILKLIRGEKR